MATSVDSRGRFVSLVSSMTGLDYRVVYAWTLAEESLGLHPPGQHNWLNLRTGSRTRGYSGVPVTPAGNGFASFTSVDDAAREAAYWITQKPQYAPIRSSAGRPASVQLAAITRSPWAGGHYNGGRSLLAAFRSAPGGAGAASSANTPVLSILPYPPFVDPFDVIPGGTKIPSVPGLPDIGGAVNDFAGGVAKWALRLVLILVVLGLAAALFYNGVRRLSGDRLPSTRDVAEVAAASRTGGAV